MLKIQINSTDLESSDLFKIKILKLNSFQLTQKT